MKIILRNPAGLLFVLSLILAQACSGNKTVNENSETIVIDLESNIGKGNVVDLSSVASEIEYIPLQTSENTLTDDAESISFENGMFYLITRRFSKGCQVFDIKGNHIFFFDRTGRGPEEYFFVYDSQILPGTGNILIHGENGIRRVYDPHGNFLEKFNVPKDSRFGVSPILYISEGNYAGAVSMYRTENLSYAAVLFTPGDTTFRYMFPIPQFQTKDPFIGPNEFAGMSEVPSSSQNFKLIRGRIVIYGYEDKARLFFPYNDTLFSISPEKKIETPFLIKFGKTRNPGGKDGDASMDKYVLMKGSPMENHDFLFLEFHLKGLAHEPYEKEIILRSGRIHRYKVTDCYALLNKKSGEFTLLNLPEKNLPGMKEDILNGPPFWPKYVSSTGELVSFCSAEELIRWAENHKVSPKLKKIIEKLDENDNPVVILAKLKKQ
ncbi:MAG: 6-bladed beta-propeller [Bacteroidales bacterium]|nr:6-bladed beta-propeller [Bacteroidales bacterium]MDD2424809.1 6-bladed beta-propeller [Bacteroidales bacterium]MDD3989954.1 6-bladed beta-propeller [Bacteroidales bacterium]MDD4638649.1 6-bladed beta-propeller [Bacteroidales bacterium]